MQRSEIEIGSQSGSISKDILGVLLKAQRTASIGDTLPESEIIGEITFVVLSFRRRRLIPVLRTLLFAAQDTTSSAVSRVLHVLAMHPSTQSSLRDEVRKAVKQRSTDSTEPSDCEFGSYDDLMRLPLLDAIVRETLRLYPPVSWIWRVARAPTSLPLRKPIILSNGAKVDAIPVAVGQGIIVGIAAAHRDRSVWGDDADEWKPERWLVAAEHEEGGDEWKRGTVLTDETRYPGIYSGMCVFDSLVISVLS